VTEPLSPVENSATGERLRYGLALAISCLFALFAMGGLSMGGPSGMIGWFALILCLALPAVIWWTRNRAAAPLVQSLPFLLALLTICMIVLTELGTPS
jgi:hypothetical protein